MRTLTVSLNRDLLDQIVSRRHELAALKKQGEELRNVLSGEVDKFTEDKLAALKKGKFARAIIIGERRQGGLQNHLAAALASAKHECTDQCKHAGEGWRDELWGQAVGIQGEIMRLNWELERVEAKARDAVDALAGLEKQFCQNALDVAVMTAGAAG